MSSFAARLQQIDIRSKLIVNGFIRESQKLLPFEDNAYYNLNALIVQICLLYYAINEYWDKVSSAFITEQNGTVLKRVSDYWDNANFGKVIVPSIGDCIYEWYLRINQSKSGSVFIGIIDAKCDNTNKSIIASTNKYSKFVYHGFIESSRISFLPRSYVQLKYRTGYDILIRMNTEQGELEFYKMTNNGKGMELSLKADYKQDKYLSYKIAASIFDVDTCITLTKFQVYTHK